MLALALNCEARPPDHHQDTGTPLAVAVGGCTALFQPAICLRKPGPGPLVLWTDEPWPARTTWSMTWRTRQGLVVPLEFTTEFTTDSAGTAWVVHAPITSGHVELRGSEGRGFTLEIRTLSDAYAAATTPTALSAEARGPIRALWTALDLDPREGYLLDCIDAQSTWTTDAKTPSRLAKAANEIGDVSCRAKAHRTSAPAALDKGQYKIVAADIEVLRTAGSFHLESRVYADYFAGVLELRRGQLDLSLVRLKQLADFAARVEIQAERESVFDKLALVYFRLGYDDRARELEADLRESTWVLLKSNLLWLAVLRREVDPEQTDPVPEFEALLGEPGLDAKTAQNVRLNLAFALTQNKEFDAAGKLLAEVDRSEFRLDDHVFASIADARVAAGRGELPKARTILSTALERASQGPDAEHELRVLYERAQLEVDAGEFASGREYYAKAEATTQQRLLEFGPSADLSALSGIHTRPRARYLQLLFDLGDFDELRCVMLGARARHYQQLATRSEALDDDPKRVERLLEIAALRTALETDIKTNWDAASDELERLRDDWAEQRAKIAKAYSNLDKNRDPDPSAQICAPATEAEHGRLLMHPGVGKAQWMFAFESKGTLDVFTLEQGEQSLAEFVAAIYAELDSRGHLDPLEQLTVVPVRELIAANFSTPSQSFSVRYSLGLGPRTTSTHSSNALVYAPTRGELPGAEGAAKEIDMSLGQAGWSTARERPALDARPLPELFVYAGHGELAGDFGWDSRLVFGDEQELTSAEVIANRWGPSVVVLGACDGGTASGAVMDGGMNMAMAFILAGSDLVVASDEPVPDRAGAELLRLLFAEPPTIEHAGAELQQALTRAQAGAGQGTYASWRVWVR